MIDNEIIYNVEREAKNYFVSSNPTHDWSHVERVLTLSERIGKSENADKYVVRLAVLLHDTGRELEDKSKGELDHTVESEKIAKEILSKYGLEKSISENIYHCILAHRFRSRNGHKPKTKEAKILYDADKLDTLGAIGVARVYSFSGENNQKLYSNFDDHNPGTGYETDHSPLKEFYSKAMKIKLFTEEGRKIAEKRLNFVIEFFSRLEREVKGEL
jgi:uncharacterized protein